MSEKYIRVEDIKKVSDPYKDHDVPIFELVRCKDCKWHEHEEPNMVWCPYVVGSWIDENGFCSRGEKRE